MNINRGGGIFSGIRSGLGIYSSGPSYDPDAQIMFNNIVSSGSSISPSLKTIANQLFLNAKANGWWSSIVEFSPMIADDYVGALTKGKFITHPYNLNNGFVAGDYSPSTGYQGNGAKYLDTQVSSSLAPMTASSSGMGIYKNTNPNTSETCEAGNADGFQILSDAALDYGLIGSTQVGEFPKATGLTSIDTDGTTLSIYNRGVSQNTASATPYITNGVLTTFIGSLNNGSPIATTSDMFSFHYIAYHMPAPILLAMYNDIQTFQTSLGRNV